MNFIRNFFIPLRTNIKSIVTAVIASAVIWVAISLQLFPDISAPIGDIHVQIKPTAYMLENNLQLAENYNLTTSVQVKGKRYDIGRMSIDDFEAVLDLSEVTSEGEKEVKIDVATSLSADFEIISSKKTAKIKVERITSKTLEVEAKTGAVRVVEGMQIDESGLKASPSTVTIKGEKSLIDSISRAEAIAVYDDEMFSTLEVKGELALFNNSNIRVENPDIALDVDYFTVTVPIHKVKTLPLDFLITGYPSNFDLAGLKSKMIITPGELTMSSSDTSIDHLNSFEVGEIPLGEINYQMLLTATRDTIAPKLPEGYKNISGQASFSLEFNGVEDYAQFEFPVLIENIVILHKPVGFNVKILTKELTVTVIGPASYVQAMSRDDIGVTLNLIGTEITSDIKTISKTVQCRIKGTKVPAWVVGYPQIDLSFSRSD